MQRVLALAVIVCLAFVSACASSGPSPQAGGASPAGWELYPGFGQFGVQIVSTPPASIEGPSEAVRARQDGSHYTVALRFPRSGEYELMLMGKPKAEADDQYTLLGRTCFSVKVDAASDWQYGPAFQKLGMAVTSAPEHEVGEEAVIVLSSAQEISLAFSLSLKRSGRSVTDAVDVSREGKETRITLFFPETGDYQLELYARPASDKNAEYAYIATTRFHATVSPPAAPAGWRVGRGFKRFGVTVVSAPQGTVTDSAEIAFTTRQEISLSYGFLDKATGKEVTAMPGLIDMCVEGTTCRVQAFFVESGDYELSLYGKTSEDKGYIAVAHIPLTAKVPDRTGTLPAHWRVHPRFWKYDIGITSAPPRDVGETMALVLSLPPDVQLFGSLKDKATDSFVSFLASGSRGREHRFEALFPKSGEYELLISGRRGGQEDSQDLARVAFLATVDDSVPRYRLWRTNGTWPEVPLARVEEVVGEWTPRGGGSTTRRHLKAVLAADFVLPIEDRSVTLRKGALLEFAMSDGQPLLRTLVFTLPGDLSQKVGNATVTFKAGTPIAVEEYGIAGVLSKAATLAVEGNEIFCPKGSRLVVDNGTLSEVALLGKGTWTFTKQVYECKGSVIVSVPCFDESPATVRITLSKAALLRFGATRFVLPRGSMIVFARAGIDHIVLAENLDLMVKGRKETIPAGWAARFDAQGAMEKYQEE